MSDNDWPSPCVICGYNGPGFHQLETHPCKKNTTERDALIEKIASLGAEVRTLKQTLDCTYGDTPGLIHCPPDKPCAMHEAERISALLNSRKRELQNVVEQICYEFSSTIAHAERSKGGMQVPFHGDFASAAQLPSVVSKMRWWVKRFTEALEKSGGIV